MVFSRTFDPVLMSLVFYLLNCVVFSLSLPINLYYSNFILSRGKNGNKDMFWGNFVQTIVKCLKATSISS